FAARREVVRRAEVHRVDTGEVDEVADLDQLGLAGRGLLQLLLGDDHVLAVTRVVAVDDVLGRHLLAGDLIDLLVPDPVRGALVDLVEVHGLVRGRTEHADRDADQAETDEAGPQRARHAFSRRSPAHTELPWL